MSKDSGLFIAGLILAYISDRTIGYCLGVSHYITLLGA